MNKIVVDAANVYAGVRSYDENTMNGDSCATFPLLLRIARQSRELLTLAPCTVFEGGQQELYSLALGGSRLFWNPAYDVSGPTTGHLFSVSVNGGGIVDLGDQNVDAFITVDETSVYYMGADLGGLTRMAFDGSQRVLLTSGGEPAVDGENLYFVRFGKGCTDVYCKKDASISVMPKTGGAVTELASQIWEPQFLTVSGGYVYWADVPSDYADAPALWRMPTSGGAKQKLVASAHVAGLAVDTSDIYWLERSFKAGQSGIYKLPLAGGTPVQLAGSDNALAIAADDEAIVWGDNGGSVWLLAK